MVSERKANGDISLRLDPDELGEREQAIDKLFGALYDLDCELVGDIRSLGNFDMAYDLYSYYNNKMLMLTGSDMEKFINGEKIKLFAHDLDSEERNMVRSELKVSCGY